MDDVRIERQYRDEYQMHLAHKRTEANITKALFVCANSIEKVLEEAGTPNKEHEPMSAILMGRIFDNLKHIK